MSTKIKFTTRELEGGELEITGIEGRADNESMFYLPQKELLIPSTIDGRRVASIGDGALQRIYGVDRVCVGEGVKNIGCYVMFNGAYKEVVLPSTLEKVDMGAFAANDGLKFKLAPQNEFLDVDSDSLLSDDGTVLLSCMTRKEKYRVPDSVERITAAAFANLSRLKTIVLNANLVEIDDDTPFFGCGVLMEILVDEGNFEFVSLNGVLFRGFDGAELRRFPPGRKDESYVVPVTTRKISGRPFSETSLRSISLGAWVEDLGDSNPFAGAPFLERIEIDDSNLYLRSDDGVARSRFGSELFAYPAARADEEYVVPTGVSTIENGAFYGAKNLRRVVLGDEVNAISGAAFANSGLETIEFPAELRTIERNVCDGCVDLERATLPDRLATIEEGAFKDCLALEEISLPDGLVEIGEDAFHGCLSLEEIALPESVSVVGPGAFRESGIKRAYLPEYVDDDFSPEAFDRRTTLFVREGSPACEWASKNDLKFHFYD